MMNKLALILALGLLAGCTKTNTYPGLARPNTYVGPLMHDTRTNEAVRPPSYEVVP